MFINIIFSVNKKEATTYRKKKIRPGFCFLFICRHKFKTIVRNLRNFVVLFCCNEDILGLRDSLHLILTLYHQILLACPRSRHPPVRIYFLSFFRAAAILLSDLFRVGLTSTYRVYLFQVVFIFQVTIGYKLWCVHMYPCTCMCKRYWMYNG